jgi:hypothetical protein
VEGIRSVIVFQLDRTDALLSEQLPQARKRHFQDSRFRRLRKK